MKIITTTIKDIDLKKLMKKAKINSYKELATKSRINYKHFLRNANGHHCMSSKNFDKIKIVLDRHSK